MLESPGQRDMREFSARLERLADSGRVRRLDALEKLWKGKYADHKPSFWDLEVPLQERAPCVQSSIAETAGARLVAMVFGEGRFPAATVGESSWGSDFSAKEIEQLNALIANTIKTIKGRLVMRAGLEQGLMVGTLCVVGSVEQGRLKCRLFPAKWCEPEFASDGETVIALEIRYRYDRKIGEKNVTCWYRRRIDTETDTVWRDVEANADGYEPEWGEGLAIEHGLGFCPVLWHRNMPDVSDCNPIDGSALFDGLEDEIAALDMSMSQRHRNGRMFGDPQVVVIGPDAVDPMQAAMSEGGRAVDPAKGSWFSQVYDRVGRWLGTGGKSAIKKAPNQIWRLKEGSSATLLETNGAGAKVLSDDAAELRRTILDARGIVIASPEQVSANASAALMHELFAPMVNVAANYRDEYEEVLAGIVNMMLRIARAVVMGDKFVALRGLKEALPSLGKCEVSLDDGTKIWVGLPINLAWGPYFAPTAADRQAEATAAVAATGRPVLTTKTALQALAATWGVKDIDAEVAALDENASASAASLKDTLGALSEKPDEQADGPDTEAVDPQPSDEESADVKATPEAKAAAAGEIPEIYAYDYDAGIITVNEARERKGLPPIAGGQVTVLEWRTAINNRLAPKKDAPATAPAE